MLRKSLQRVRMSAAIADFPPTGYYLVVETVGKMLIVAGLILTGFGLLIWFGGKTRSGLLPGDIFVDRGGFKVYFPIVTCVVVSVLLSLLLWLFRR